jgi:hypothetical protein
MYLPIRDAVTRMQVTRSEVAAGHVRFVSGLSPTEPINCVRGVAPTARGRR